MAIMAAIEVTVAVTVAVPAMVVPGLAALALPVACIEAVSIMTR
jgi:hypothetical protein